MKSAIFLLLGLISHCASYAQSTDDHEGHHHHRHEIGLANAPVYFVKERVLSYGLHLHYVYNFHHSQWGMGLGYERIFDVHQHQTYSLVASYRPVDRLSLIAAPGITFEAEHSDEAQFALHLEGTYEFTLGNFHLGPVLEWAYDPQDYHVSLGLHTAVGF